MLVRPGLAGKTLRPGFDSRHLHHFNQTYNKKGRFMNEGTDVTRLSDLSPKWRQLPHIKVALKEHLKDMMEALEREDSELLLKEATDTMLVLQAFLDQEDPRKTVEMCAIRFLKFESTGSLPPLA